MSVPLLQQIRRLVAASMTLNQADKSTVFSLVDIGANLHHRSYPENELQAVLDRAKAAGVSKIMVTGTSAKNCKQAIRLSQLYPNYLYSTAGIHPHDAKTFNDQSLHELEAFAAHPECVAIGECGLDFNRNFSPQSDQLHAFEQQVQLACKLQKPLFVHEREAHSSLVEILQKQANLPPTVIHCFTGTIDEATSYLNMGLYIGLTGFLWKDKLPNGVQAALKAGVIPLERLMVETDSPFMFPNIENKKLPEEIRSKISENSKNFLQRYCSFNRNEPCALPTVVDLIAAFMGVSPETVAFHTTVNATKVFGLGINCTKK